MYLHICSHDHKNAHKQEFIHAHNDLDTQICTHMYTNKYSTISYICICKKELKCMLIQVDNI